MANVVKITVTGDDKASAVLDKTAKKAGGLKKVFGDVAKVAGGIILAKGLAAAPGIISGVISSAADLELSMKKVDKVFGDQVGVVRDWAENNAAAMGLSKNEAAGLAANMADLLIPMGFTREAAAKMATETQGLVGALTEWNTTGLTSADVSDILNKAFLGETEGLKALGISLKQSDITTRLAAKGQEELTGQALQQAKALVIQELVMEKSTDAQDAYAEGAGSVARKQAEMGAAISDLKDDIIIGLTPAISAVTSFLADNLPKAIAATKDGFEKIEPFVSAFTDALGLAFGAVKPIFEFLDEHREVLAAIGIALAVVMTPSIIAWTVATIANTVAHVALAVATLLAYAPIILITAGIALLVLGIILLVKHWEEITDFMQGALKEALEFVGEKFTWVKDQIVEKFGLVFSFLKKHAPLIAAIILSMFLGPLPLIILAVIKWRTQIMEKFNGVISWLKGIPGAILDALGNLGSLLLEAGKDLIRGFIRGMTSISIPSPASLIGKGISAVGGFFRGHQGGIVPGRTGEEVLAVLQAGERVIPINQVASGAQGGAGGNTYIDQVIIQGDQQAGLAALGLAGAI